MCGWTTRSIPRVLIGGLVLVASAALGTGPHATATGDGSPADPNLVYVGRWDYTDGATYNSYWGGAYLRASFTGTSIKIKLATPTNFIAEVDGRATVHWNQGGTVDLTPTPLPDGTHSLRVNARYTVDELRFQGLVLDPGASTLPPGPARPLVEFVGDSITAGDGTTHGAASDYAWLTGEQIGADHTQIAFPGITLADGYHYPWLQWPGMESAYLNLKPVHHCADVACAGLPLWDFANYTPDLVVVNLGTNDANAWPSTPAATFRDRYTTFLQTVRTRFPNADLFALRTFGNHYVIETQAAVGARVGAGDPKVHLLDTTGWLAESDSTDGVHPNDCGQVKITRNLVAVLQPYLATPANLVGNPGLETGSLCAWSQWNNSVVGADARSGTQSMLIGASGPGGGWQTIDGLRPDTTYTLTGWAKVSEPGVEVRVGVQDFGDAETYQSITGTGYTQGSVAFTTGAAATSAIIYCYKPTASGTASCDDFTLSTSAAGAPYATLAAMHSGRCLDVPAGSMADGAAMTQWTCHRGANQQWRFAPAADGHVQIVNRRSDSCLDVFDGSTADGAKVIQRGCSGRPNQQWTLSNLGAGGFQMIARHSGKCLDVAGRSEVDGAAIVQWTCGPGQNQQWHT